MKGKAYLIARCCVYFCSQRLGFGLGGKEVLGLIQAEAQDLPIQVIVLIPQFVILLWEQSKSTRAKGSIPCLCPQATRILLQATRPLQGLAQRRGMPQSSVRRGTAALLGRTRKAEVFPLFGPMGRHYPPAARPAVRDLAEGGAILDSLQEGQFVFLAPPTALVVAVSRHTEGSRHRCPLQFLPIAHPRDLGAPPGWVMG